MAVTPERGNDSQKTHTEVRCQCGLSTPTIAEFISYQFFRCRYRIVAAIANNPIIQQPRPALANPRDTMTAPSVHWRLA